MPGSISTIQGSQPVEYVEETTFANPVADPSMNWIGLVTAANVTVTPVEEVVKYLPDDSNAIDLQTLTAEKVSEMYNVEITYHPQDLSFVDYFTGSTGSLSNTLTSIQLGMQDKNNGEFSRVLGMVGEELELTIEEDSVAEATATFLAADHEDWTSTDFIGAGSHATANSAAPLQYGDLGSVNWGGSPISDAVESLTLTISNDLEVVKDPDSSLESHIEAIVPVDREITSELSLTYDDFSMVDDVRSFTKQDLTFTFGPSSESWTVSNVAFPEVPYEFGPEDLIGDTVTSVPAENLTYS